MRTHESWTFTNVLFLAVHLRQHIIDRLCRESWNGRRTDLAVLREETVVEVRAERSNSACGHLDERAMLDKLLTRGLALTEKKRYSHHVPR